VNERLRDAILTQQPQAFLWLPVFFGCGIAIYFSQAAEPKPWLVGGLVVFCLVLSLALVMSQRGGRAVLLLLLALPLGFLDAKWRAHSVAAPVLAASFYGYVEGTIVGIDRSASNAPRIVLSDVTLAKTPPYTTPEHVRINLLGWIAPGALSAGQRVVVTASLSPPGAPVEPGGFDFRRMAWFKGLGAVGYSRHPMLVAGPPAGAGWQIRIFRARMRIADAIRARLPGQKGAFAAAILTGDRSAIDPDVTTTLRSSNLAHLLAISGLHMGLLTGFVFTLVRYGLALVPTVALWVQTKKIGAVAALVAGLCYLILSGANVATQRAFVMAAVVLLAVLLDRPAFTLRAVALAAMVILVWRPESLTGAGFQMSFAATTALVAAFEWLRHRSWWRVAKGWRQRIFRPLVVLIISSSVAGAATAPFAAYHFNQIVPFGLAANLTAVPLMGLLVMPSAVMAALLWPLGLEGLGLAVMGQGIALILDIASYVAAMPGAVRKVPSGGPLTLPLMTLGGLFFLLWLGRAWAIGLVAVAAGLLHWSATERPDLLISDGARLVGFRSENGRVLTRKRGEGFTAKTWLENDGDRADQKKAWGRQRLKTVDGRISARLVNGWHLIIVEKAGTKFAWKDDCRAGVIVLSASSGAPEKGKCLFIGQEEVNSLGSMAIDLSAEPPRLTGARNPENARLWSVRPQ